MKNRGDIVRGGGKMGIFYLRDIFLFVYTIFWRNVIHY